MSLEPCPCMNWCVGNMNDIINGNGHHPRCEHYSPNPLDPRYAIFGKLMWELITKNGGEFCGDEWSEDVLPLAQAAGLCSRVIYSPDVHGTVCEAEPGDEIWWWGDDNSETVSS